MQGDDSEEWLDAMASEIKSMLKNNTWEIVDKPKNEKTVGCKMILKNKINLDGITTKRKARLVAKGYNQQPGIHFKETFAPVARLSSLRLLTAIATQCNMKIRQLDVKTAYLNANLDEEIYMEIPELLEEILEKIIKTEREDMQTRRKAINMKEKIHKNKVCLLKKSLYGLKQSGRQCNKTLDSVIKAFGANQTDADPCMYYVKMEEEYMYILTYVDDILIASKSKDNIKKFEEYLSQIFDLTIAGDLKRCLGIEFERTDTTMTLKQTKYIEDILLRFRMNEANPVKTPLSTGQERKENEENDESNNIPYRELVGALTYLSVATRPDITFAVSYLSQFNSNYKREHWNMAKRVLRYIKGTKNIGITYQANGDMESYADADWANCKIDRRSFTGYIFLLSKGPISWSSRKQRTVALSSTEAEYMALTEAVKEAIYLKKLLTELKCEDLQSNTIYCDNAGTKKLAENAVYHSRTKHIDVRHHFIRENVKNKVIEIKHKRTEEMLADILTKGLPYPRHQYILEKIGLNNITNITD